MLNGPEDSRELADYRKTIILGARFKAIFIRTLLLMATLSFADNADFRCQCRYVSDSDDKASDLLGKKL